MTKLIKFSGRAFGALLEWVLIICILFVFVIRSSYVQTYIAQHLTDYLSKELNTTIRIDRVSIVFIDRAALHGLYIEDQQGDTLFFADQVLATIHSIDVARNSFKLGSVKLRTPYIHIIRDSSGLSNHLFLRDYFSKPGKTPKTVHLDIASFQLINGHFRYDDNRKQRIENGMDYWHLDVKQIHARIVDFKVVGRDYKGTIRALSGIDKCGFELSRLSAKAHVNSSGAHLRSLELFTPNSRIYSNRFDLRSKTFNAFNYFVDSVRFDCRIDSSLVDLKDIVHFSPSLKGIDGTVSLSTDLKNKVPKMSFPNLELKFGKRSVIRGDFKIDDYRKIESGFYDEYVEYAFLDYQDLMELRLPVKYGYSKIPSNEYLERIGFMEIEHLKFKGGKPFFSVMADQINTSQGSVVFISPVEFTLQNDGGYRFTAFNGEPPAVIAQNIQLGALLNRTDVGVVNGNMNIIGFIGGNSKFSIQEMNGTIQRFDYLDYSYSGIKVHEGNFKDNKIIGKIDVKDNNIDLTYEGYMDFSGQQKMEFTVDISEVLLDKVNLSEKDSKLSSKIAVNITGKSANEMSGQVTLEDFSYQLEGKDIAIADLNLTIERSPAIDRFVINSDIANATLEGKIDLEHLSTTVRSQLANILPSLFELSEKEKNSTNQDRYTYTVQLKNTQPLFDVFIPSLKMANNSVIQGRYSGSEEHFDAQLNSDSIRYGKLYFAQAQVNQVMDSSKLKMNFNAESFRYGDTLTFDHFAFVTNGENDQLFHTLNWDLTGDQLSELSWSTEFFGWEHFQFCIDPSYFYLNKNKWNVLHEANLNFIGDTIQVNNLELARGEQKLKLNGLVSKNPKHHLDFNADNFDLSELTGIFFPQYQLSGTLDGWGFVSTPFTQINFEGDAVLKRLIVNKQVVGDIYLQSFWNDATKSIYSTGDLIYRGEKTFDFEGNYFIHKEDENLDFELHFENTDIQIANAFLDPEVLREVRGLLNGSIKLTGTPQVPITEGDLMLHGGSVLVPFLGTHFNTEGIIRIDEYGFYADYIPVFDEDGNAGAIVGSVYHDNFKDFSFDLNFDLENDAINKDPLIPWKPRLLDRFLIMNAAYSPDVLYYGKGVATGMVNIFGYTDNLEITVDLTTKKGTHLKIPMYGIGEMDDDNNFIVFRKELEDTLEAHLEKQFDLSGVSLDLNFHATPDATVEIIFDENVGDIISATGYGDINIGVNNLGEVTMNGNYTVENGIYDFALGVIKKQFFIEKGGSISWTGDPYDALLNLKTYYKVNANIAGISDDQIASGTGAHQPVLCYLNLSESLLRPSIEFDIKAPEANEIAKSLINRVTADKDELNRQFFSLLLFRKFQPLNKSSYSGSVGAELLTNQINSILSSVSADYNLGVNFDSDQYSGDKQYEFMVSRTFLNNRLILTGSFGVENHTGSETAETDFIGDISVEYLINESGTFRGKIFNESNDRTIILQSDRGRFTQGFGVNYKEDFNNSQDFKAIQYFFDLFRKKGNKKFPIKRKKQERKVPSNKVLAIIEEAIDPELL
jgi:hypothetical protein